MGKIGEIVAKAASSNIAGLLGHKYGYSEMELENSGYIGAERKQCKKFLQCKDVRLRNNVWLHLVTELAENLF